MFVKTPILQVQLPAPICKTSKGNNTKVPFLYVMIVYKKNLYA